MTAALSLNEQQFTNQVLGYAKVFGWRRFHVRTSGRMNGSGGAIPTVQGDKGFPDLVLVKERRIIFAELKVGSNKRSAEQVGWHEALMGANVESYEWRPEQWSSILVVLSK